MKRNESCAHLLDGNLHVGVPATKVQSYKRERNNHKSKMIVKNQFYTSQWNSNGFDQRLVLFFRMRSVWNYLGLEL